MTFWHNEKYESVEKFSLKGDFIRGVAPKNFPWILNQISCYDFDRDLWEIKVLCLSIETHEFTQKVKAKISLQAHCYVNEENLKKLGIHYERLFNLNFQNWNLLTEKFTLEIDELIDKIEEKSSKFYQIFFKKIKDKYTLEKKKEQLNINIKNCRVSNFS